MLAKATWWNWKKKEIGEKKDEKEDGKAFKIPTGPLQLFQVFNSQSKYVAYSYLNAN